LARRGRDGRQAGALRGQRSIEEQRGALGTKIKNDVVPGARLPGNRGLQNLQRSLFREGRQRGAGHGANTLRPKQTR
jgi:hypothetical protein